jgi:hypothetical protein
LTENFTGIAIEAKRFGRGAQTSTGASAPEQWLPQFLLERLEPRRDGGLGNTEALGRLYDTAAVDNRNKDTQVLNLHRVFLWLCIEDNIFIYVRCQWYPGRGAVGTIRKSGGDEPYSDAEGYGDDCGNL